MRKEARSYAMPEAGERPQRAGRAVEDGESGSWNGGNLPSALDSRTQSVNRIRRHVNSCPQTTDNVMKKENGAPERIRTSDPQIRSLMLYPAELRAHWEATGTSMAGLITKPSRGCKPPSCFFLHYRNKPSPCSSINCLPLVRENCTASSKLAKRSARMNLWLLSSPPISFST